MWGFETYDLANLPRRLLDFSDPDSHTQAVLSGLDPNRLKSQPTPAESLRLDATTGWASMSHRSIARVTAMFLVAEDPQRRLDARPVETLAHQVSLVRHVLEKPSLQRVLIADEVGLGKTVEVGMLLRELLAERPQLRVLYLAPARLVTNVAPDRPSGWIHQSYTLHEMKRTQEAMQLLLPIVEQFPEEGIIAYNLACYACQLGDLAGAKIWLERASKVKGKLPLKEMAREDPDLVPLLEFIKHL
jgi:hypothetical protein